MYIRCWDNKYDEEGMMKKLLIILLVFWGCMVSSARASEQTPRWETMPSFQFQSTATCASAVGSSAFATTTVYEPCCSAPGKPRKSGSYNPWDEDGNGVWDEGDPTGQAIGQVDTPLASPLILLLFAALYLLTRSFHRRRYSE